MLLLMQLLFVIVRPIFAVFLTLGGVIGVAASIVIMNLLVGYFSVASDAYVSVHPHLLIKGSWSAEHARALADRLPGLDPQIVMAAPAIHVNRTITLATVNVITDLCDSESSAEDNCAGKRSMDRAVRTYAYDVIEQKQVDVQIRGIVVANNDTVANYRRVMSGVSDLARLSRDRDSGGNEMPVAFIAQDTLIGDIAGSYLISAAALAPAYKRYYRLHGVIRLGAKSSGDPLLVMGLEQARSLAPSDLKGPNTIEVRLAAPLAAQQVARRLMDALEGGLSFETWIDKERSAFEFLNATWVMVFSVMLSICLVVAISIYSTLTLSILRNRWKVALLGSIGLTPLRIAMIFMSFACGVALIGISGGVLLGEYLSYLMGGILYNVFLELPPERFAATVTWRPAAWMAAATVAIFILSAIMPVRQAVAIRPAEALRGAV
jgi:ABC-type lipoprotein release transport system permease subunit